MHDSMSDYFNDVLCQCSFREGLGVPNCLLYIIETIQKTPDIHEVLAAFMTDLSKALDTISHKLLVAKLHAYGFDESS